MTNEEAKFILTAYRANGGDAREPAFLAALEQARNDPGLARWLAREQAHAETVARKLREIVPPAELRAAIFAGARAGGLSRAGSPRMPARIWFAAAALLLVGATIGTWWMTARVDAEGRLMTAAIEHATQGSHGGHGAPAEALQARLSDVRARLGEMPPIDFANLKSTGCRTLRIAGHDVLEVCFVREGAEYHLYVARAEDFGRERAGEATFRERAAVAVASWADAEHRFVLVTDAGMDAVRRLL